MDLDTARAEIIRLHPEMPTTVKVAKVLGEPDEPVRAEVESLREEMAGVARCSAATRSTRTRVAPQPWLSAAISGGISASDATCQSAVVARSGWWAQM